MSYNWKNDKHYKLSKMLWLQRHDFWHLQDSLKKALNYTGNMIGTETVLEKSKYVPFFVEHINLIYLAYPVKVWNCSYIFMIYD